MYISIRPVADSPCLFDHVLEISERPLLSLSLIHAYLPQSKGKESLWYKTLLITGSQVALIICGKCKNDLFHLLFYTNFFIILFMYNSLRVRAETPTGIKLCWQQGALSLLSPLGWQTGTIWENFSLNSKRLQIKFGLKRHNGYPMVIQHANYHPNHHAILQSWWQRSWTYMTPWW